MISVISGTGREKADGVCLDEKEIEKGKNLIEGRGKKEETDVLFMEKKIANLYFGAGGCGCQHDVVWLQYC